MVFGCNPQRWNEREPDPRDPLGLNHYTMKPDILAIRQSANLYVYCLSNPVMFSDPSGQKCCCIVKQTATYLWKLAERYVPLAWEQAKKAGTWVSNQATMGANWISNKVSGWISSVSQARTVNNLIRTADQLQRSNTVQRKAAERPYIQSTHLLQQIMRAAPPTQDPESTTGLKWVVEGALNGRLGVFELVVDPVTHTIWHFQFKSAGR